ncbi:MAG: hypothetical protein ABW252_24530 [Polyangiales bacterium]
MKSASIFSLLPVLASLAAACGGDDTTPPPALDAGGASPAVDGGTSAPSGSTTTTPPPGSASPLFVSSSRVFGTDDSTGYLFAFRTLDKGTTIDLKQALEIEDGWVFGDAKPYFYTATIFAPKITRWTITPEGKFEQGPVLDLTNQGVMGTYSAAAVPMLSADKSYFVDPPSNQLVVWNPREMTFLKTIPLPSTPRANLTPELDSNLAVRGNRVYVTQFYRDENSMNTRFGESAHVYAVDTATDTVVATQEDTRCGALSQAGTASDGSVYYGPWDYFATVRSVFGAGFGTKSCSLRIAPGADALDPAYEVNLSTLVGGRPAGSIQLLSPNELLLHVWHDELVHATPQNWANVRFEPAYFWYRWRIGDATATLLPDQKPTGEGADFRRLDGKLVSYAADAEYANTTLWQLGDDGRQTELLTIPGWTTNALRAY